MREGTLIEALEATLDPVRATVGRQVERTSLRIVARQIGMSPEGLKKFLGGSSPYRPALRRLRAWYLQQSTRSPGLGLLDARAALEVLLAGLAPDARRDAAIRLLETVGRGYDEAGDPWPEWLLELHAEHVAEAPGGTRGSALGKYRDLGGASEEFARSKRSEIEREDRSAA